MTTIFFNALLAAFAAFVSFGCLVRMTRQTKNSIRVAVILITVALLGAALGVAKGEWATWLDTLLYGGICAFLIGNRRLPPHHKCTFCEHASERASMVVSGITILWVGVQWGMS